MRSSTVQMNAHKDGIRLQTHVHSHIAHNMCHLAPLLHVYAFVENAIYSSMLNGLEFTTGMADFLKGCWLQMASCSPASTRILCHSSRDRTGKPAMSTPAFFVRRKLVLEAAVP